MSCNLLALMPMSSLATLTVIAVTPGIGSKPMNRSSQVSLILFRARRVEMNCSMSSLMGITAKINSKNGISKIEAAKSIAIEITASFNSFLVLGFINIKGTPYL